MNSDVRWWLGQARIYVTFWLLVVPAAIVYCGVVVALGTAIPRKGN